MTDMSKETWVVYLYTEFENPSEKYRMRDDILTDKKKSYSENFEDAKEYSSYEEAYADLIDNGKNKGAVDYAMKAGILFIDIHPRYRYA
jgi:hypothetical protein